MDIWNKESPLSSENIQHIYIIIFMIINHLTSISVIYETFQLFDDLETYFFINIFLQFKFQVFSIDSGVQ